MLAPALHLDMVLYSTSMAYGQALLIVALLIVALFILQVSSSVFVSYE